MEKLSYCENCCKDVEFDIINEIVTVDLKDMKFTYGAIVPYCKECKKEISIAEITDLNILRAYKAQKDALELGK
jgi:hypothetical protein